MKIEKIFEILNSNKVDFVLIGGTALINYGSNRVTFDTDIVVKFLDIVIKLLYKHKLKLVIGVSEDQFPVTAENYNILVVFAI